MFTRKCTYRYEKKNLKKKGERNRKINYQKGFWDELVTSDINNITLNLI